MQTTGSTSNTRQPRRAKILLATLAALCVAILVLLTIVLPAEFDRDPLGVGEALGIRGLSRQPQLDRVRSEKIGYGEDAVSFELLPFEFVEYKYRLHEGGTMLYRWSATAAVVAFDFHGEPDDGPEGFAESYRIGKADRQNGAFTAPFSGIHGWFWENRGTHPVTVTVTTAGFYSAALQFRDGLVSEKRMNEDAAVAPDPD